MKKILRLDVILPYIVVLFMPLSIYPILLNGITLGDLVIIVGLVMVIYKSIVQGKKLKIVFPLFIYGFTIAILSLLHWLLGLEDMSDGIFSVLRYLLYVIFCMIIPRNYLNFEETYHKYKKIAIIFAIYAVLQFIFYKVFKKILPTNVLGLKTYGGIYNYNSISRYSNQAIIYRPCSVFAEPAHYASYMAPILYMLVNDVFEKNKTNKWLGVLIIISILISGSTTGIIAIMFCLIKPVGRAMQKDLIRKIFLVTLLVVALFIFFKTSYGNSILERIFSDKSYGAINGRFGNMDIIFSDEYNLLIGDGLKTDIVGYVPSYTQLLISFGIIGTITYLFTVVQSFICCNNLGKTLLIEFLLICIGTLALFGISSILYFTLIYVNYGNNEENKELVEEHN